MALQAISHFCTMPILFHKLEGFPGKRPWGLPVTLAVTKPGLWRCGLHLDSSPAAQATSRAERLCERELHSKPGILSVRQSHCTASSQPGSLEQHKNVLKPEGLTQESWSGLLSALVLKTHWLKICHLFALMTYCWNNLMKMTYLDPQLLICRTACETTHLIFSYLCPAVLMFQDSITY